jgi:hypothetical protein
MDHVPPAQPDPGKRECTLLLFVATSDEEKALKQALRSRSDRSQC